MSDTTDSYASLAEALWLYEETTKASNRAYMEAKVAASYRLENFTDRQRMNRLANCYEMRRWESLDATPKDLLARPGEPGYNEYLQLDDGGTCNPKREEARREYLDRLYGLLREAAQEDSKQYPKKDSKKDSDESPEEDPEEDSEDDPENDPEEDFDSREYFAEDFKEFFEEHFEEHKEFEQLLTLTDYITDMDFHQTGYPGIGGVCQHIEPRWDIFGQMWLSDGDNARWHVLTGWLCDTGPDPTFGSTWMLYAHKCNGAGTPEQQEWKWRVRTCVDAEVGDDLWFPSIVDFLKWRCRWFERLPSGWQDTWHRPRGNTGEWYETDSEFDDPDWKEMQKRERKRLRKEQRKEEKRKLKREQRKQQRKQQRREQKKKQKEEEDKEGSKEEGRNDECKDEEEIRKKEEKEAEAKGGDGVDGKDEDENEEEVQEDVEDGEWTVVDHTYNSTI